MKQRTVEATCLCFNGILLCVHPLQRLLFRCFRFNEVFSIEKVYRAFTSSLDFIEPFLPVKFFSRMHTDFQLNSKTLFSYNILNILFLKKEKQSEAYLSDFDSELSSMHFLPRVAQFQSIQFFYH